MTDFGQQMTNELRFDLRKWEWNEHFEWQMMGCWPTWAKIHWNTRDFHFSHHSWIYGDYWNCWMSPLALFVCPTDQPCTARCAGLNALSPENMAQLSTFLSQVWSGLLQGLLWRSEMRRGHALVIWVFNFLLVLVRQCLYSACISLFLWHIGACCWIILDELAFAVLLQLLWGQLIGSALTWAPEYVIRHLPASGKPCWQKLDTHL